MFEGSIPHHFDDYELTQERKDALQFNVNLVKEGMMVNGVNGNNCVMIEGTEGQKESEKWLRERCLRVTASKCKSVNAYGEKLLGGRGKEVHGQMYRYISTNLWNPKHVQTKDMKYGIDEEPNARKAYTDASGRKVLETGMWINTSHPYIGASPDGLIVNDSGENVGTLEVKCLKVLKELSVLELKQKIEQNEIPRVKLSSFCFELKDGQLVLKESHMYYYQIQLQMLATGLPFCDFVLHTPKGPPSIQRISENRHFQMGLARNIKAFWEKVFIPEYFEMRVPRRLLPFVLSFSQICSVL